MLIDIKKVLIPGFSLVAVLKNKQYHCKVCKEKKDEGFLVRLNKPDQTAFAVVVNSLCTVQCVTDAGYVCKFESKVIHKAIPVIGLSYPKNNELEGINVRKQERTSVSFWTAILALVTENGIQRLKPIGDGNIADMTIKGCRIMTNIEYKLNDTIFLSFEYQEGKDPLTFDGIVRQIRPAPYGSTYYGLEYDDPEPEFLEIVQFILDNPEL